MFVQKKIKPEDRRKKLRELLNKKRLIRAMEAHNGISALIANNAKIEIEDNEEQKILEFDALWASGFTDSASKGFPDTEIVSLDSRLSTVEQVANVTDKPLIVDGDTGRDVDSLEYFLTKLERLGVSAVVIEDKTYPKRNSLDPDAIQNLEDPNVFANKIRLGKKALLSEDFMIFARIESMIAGCGVEDALFRAKEYLRAGADGILIHSRENDPTNVLRFAKGYNELCEKLGFRKPLICVPTTYNMITEKELKRYGFNIVIYANHLLRTSVKSMEDVCKMILLSGRGFETEPYCAPVNEIFDVVGFTSIKQRDIQSLMELSKAKVIIPAAGEPKEEIIKDMPTAMLDVNGKSLLQRQLDVLRRCRIADVMVVRGYQKERLNVGSVNFYDVDDCKRGSLFSLFAAEEKMENGFMLIFSDIIFDESIINNLLRSKWDITIVADASYPFHRHEIDKELDLIIGKQKSRYYREPSLTTEKEVSFIGKKIKKDIATHEFIGIAKFSAYGAQSLMRVYEDCAKNHKGRFHESESFERASIVDMFQEMIDRGFKVNYIETNKGWMEIHNKKDYEVSKKMVF
jgi:phosphoenolpyruvate phosphomutase